MTTLRTTQFSDSDPAWHGPAFATIADRALGEAVCHAATVVT
jgi:hypothetical protein